jgi:phosphate transport system substrate-binding protein
MGRKATAVFALLFVLGGIVGCQGDKGDQASDAPDPTSAPEARGSLTVFAPHGFDEALSSLLLIVRPDDLPYRLQIFEGSSTEAGVQGVLNGKFDLMITMRRLRSNEPLAFAEFARTPVAIFVNPAVGIDNLTREQVAAIFSGEVTNWVELGGPDQTIMVFLQLDGDPLTEFISEYILSGRPFVETAQLVPEDRAVFPVVEGIPGAFSYAAWASKKYMEIDDSADYLDATQIEGLTPDNPDYPFVSAMGFAYLPEQQAFLQPLLDWAFSLVNSEIGQLFMERYGLQPLLPSTATPEGARNGG